jgi:hypothetical protein
MAQGIADARKPVQNSLGRVGEHETREGINGFTHLEHAHEMFELFPSNLTSNRRSLNSCLKKKKICIDEIKHFILTCPDCVPAAIGVMRTSRNER